MSDKIDLSKESCVPCQGGISPMPLPEAQKLLKNLHVEWSINSLGHLERIFLLKNFTQAINLAVKLGEVAEGEGHHPDLFVSYGKLKAEIWTHKIDGLTKSDFILAAKFDNLLKE
jgi:4a-hydroxytetrahydrobiopterin dehydratase